MPWSRILRQFLNDERVIQKMADSKPMKYAARLAVSNFYRAQELAESTAKPQIEGLSRRFQRFSRTFQEEYKKQIGKKD